MNLNKQTIMSYSNFNLLTNDIIALAKEVMPNKAIYINFLNNQVQVTMKVSTHDTKVLIEEGETIPVINAICNQIDYDQGKPLILGNAKEAKFDEKVKQTIENSNIGSYLGIPILFQNGSRFGALCAAHHEESEFEQKDIELLEKISKLFSYYLELEHIAYKDALTNLENSQFLLVQQNNMLNDGGLLIMTDLDSFKLVNDTLGHHVGDLVLKEVGHKLKTFGNLFNEVYTIRLGGDEFLIYIKDKLSNEEVNEHLNNLVKLLSVWETNIKNLPVTASIGAINFKGNDYKDFTSLLKKADKLLYEAKGLGKNTFVYK